MKKISAIFLVLILVMTLTVPAQAAGGSVSLAASSASVHRGDTFSVSVYLNNSEAIALGTVVLSYDANVFEMTGGSCHVSGASIGQVIPAQRAGTFMLSGDPQVISGQIFTFQMKVKESAAFGSYTIGSSAAVGVSTGESISSGSATVTVACNHSYGSWTKADDGNHQQTCPTCNDVKTEAHKWNAGTQTKAPTCKEAGEMTYTCTVCSATKTENIEPNHSHSYGSWVKVDDNSHKHTCTVCQTASETKPHNWNQGTVTKQGSCTEEGEITYTCVDCNATKTEPTGKPMHSYGRWEKVDDNTHKRICTSCKTETETAAHSWNNGAVTKKATCKEAGEKTYTCTGCGTTRTEQIPPVDAHTWSAWSKADANTHKRVCTVCQKEESASHSYSTAWSKNGSEHWHECSACKDKKDVAQHTPGAEATETTAQTCTTCNYILKAALGHTHSYADTWTTDESGHWYTCSGCEEKGSYAEHDFENACDPDCSVCGYTRQTTHSYGEEWECDEINHWNVCTVCGEKADEAAHVPGMEATATTAQSCTVCSYELAPALGVEEAPAGTDEAPEDAGFPWWIILLLILCAGIVLVIVIVKKKKK